MATSHVLSSATARHRLAWAVFAAVAAVGLGVAVVAAGRSGGDGSAAVTAIGGLCVIGIAAALLSSVLSPVAEIPRRGRSTAGTGYGFGFGDAGGGGGGFGGGDCGGGGGDGGGCS